MTDTQTFDIDSAILENLANKTRYAEQDGDMQSPPPSEESLSPTLPNNEPEAIPQSAKSYMQSLCEIEAQESPDLEHSPVRATATPPCIGGRMQAEVGIRPPNTGDSFESKRECLMEIRRLRTDGAWFARPYTFEDNIPEMKQAIEMARIELSDKQTVVRNKAGIKTARRVLLAGVSILEFLHRKWNPLRLHLDGFGEYVMGNIDDYDNVFQRLIEKYQGSGQMPPEIELVVMLGTSAVMFHISNMFVSRAMGNTAPAQPGRSTRPSQPKDSQDIDDEDRFE